MMEKTFDSREQISALADGELRGEAFALAVEQAGRDSQALAAWDAYHVVGEVLRNGERGARGADMAFVERLRAQIADVCPEPALQPQPVQMQQGREAANSPVWAWKAVAGFASVAAVAAIGWNMMGVQSPGNGAQLAGAPVQLVPAPAVQQAQAAPSPAPQQPVQLASGDPTQAVMIRDPRLDELLAAHKQTGGASALQMPSGFLRNATFEGPAR